MYTGALLLITFLASYLLGAVPFGYLVARGRGVDILRHGSGNIGATNVGRVLGRRYGVLVFLLDFAKGALPVAAARAAAAWAGDLPNELLGVTAGVAAFLGHLFPVYLRFRGGKGVATGAGVVVVLVPLPALAAVVTWAVVVVLTRYVSVASILAAVVLCAVRLAVTPRPWAWPLSVVSGFCLLAAGLVVARHAGNLRRLWLGTENRIKESPAMLLFSKTLHVLALGLWFGSVVFFTLAGYLIFEEFKKESLLPASERPLWLPVPKEYDRDPPSAQFPNPLRQEQGSRVAGAAVAPLFPWYYGLQLACGFVAFATALTWLKGREGEKIHRWRAFLLLIAFLTVVVGWWMEGVVSGLREPRNVRTDEVLTSAQPTAEQMSAAEKARADFGRWHGFSLIQNFVTLLLVAVAMALAARLPAGAASAVLNGKEERAAVLSSQAAELRTGITS